MTNHPTPDRPVAGDWLALREPADAAAREHSLPLIARLVRHWEEAPPSGAPASSGTDPVVVVDLGAGTGANRAWLAGHLPGPQRWILLDHDRELLDRAVAAAREDGADVVPVHAGVEELGRVLAQHPASRRLVTCSALLDLLTREQVRELARVLAEEGVPALLALTVDGEVLLDPPHHLDPSVLGAFEDHQHRGELAGTDGVRLAVEALQERGMTVDVTPTPWWVSDQEWARPLLDRFLADRADAAVEHRPDLTAEAHAWLRTRLVDCARGRLRATVGHADVLGLPPVG
ncbi:class I SAM-dependent methyltransferase [Kocuria sp. M1N1S27]|uniref:class I SAM-dependent methyltransferase n=1 Tax=Kocuria kalidii TaxID=3376283 RepID=UPI003796331F